MRGAGKLKHYGILYPYFVSSVASKLFEVKSPASAAVIVTYDLG